MSRRFRELEVEPLPEQRWRQIKGDVFDTLDRESAEPVVSSSRRWPWLVGSGVVAAAVVLAVVWTSGKRRAKPVDSSRVVTSESSTQLDFGGASFDVAPHSAVVLSGDDERGVLAVLERGKITCHVTPRKGRPPFVVRSGEVTVEVVGTVVSVQRTGDLAIVEVTRGTVRVRHRDKVDTVGAGQRWPAQTARASPTSPRKTTTKDPATKQPPPKPMVSKTKAPKRVRPRLSAKQRYQKAEALERSNPTAALALYRKVARRSGPWQSVALFAQARLQLELGNRSTARKLLKRYLQRFPDGSNAGDVSRLLKRLRK